MMCVFANKDVSSDTHLRVKKGGVTLARNELNVSDRWRELCRSKTWIDILEETAHQLPDDEALAFGDQRITHRTYAEKVTA